MVFSFFIAEVSLGCLIKIKIGNNLYSEIIPIEPEPGNAGAGNRNFRKSFGFTETLFLFSRII